MFRGREERYRAELAAELRPYQTIAVDYEAEERLRTFDMETSLAGRALLTSNDRYQVSAAYLVAARNHFLTANTISRTMLHPEGPNDYRAPAYNSGEVVHFLRSTYQASLSALETADVISSQPGYRVDQQQFQALEAASIIQRWPSIQAISRRFLEGTIGAAETVAAYTFTQFDAVRTAPQLSSGFKSRMESKVQPIFAEFDVRRSVISRVVQGSLLQERPEAALHEVYDDATLALAALSKIGLWITYPVVYDPLFRVRRPIEEARPGERKFNPTIMGPLPTAPPPRRQAPPRPARPFNPSAMPPLPPAPPDKPAHVARPFDPSKLLPLGQPAQETARPVERPFDPDMLRPAQPEPPRSARPFDPAILSRPTEPIKKRPFDPGILKNRQAEPLPDDTEQTDE